jgi:hypothetical protein
VLLTVVGKPKLNAIPPALPLTLPAPPSPPWPIIRPLLTKTIVSPLDPPVSVSPGVPTLVEYKYTPAFTVIVMSDAPVIYPGIAATFKDAFAVLAANVDEMEALFDLPYKELILQVVPLPPTPASVLTFAWFIVMVEVKPNPSSCATLTGEDVPPIFNGPLDGIVIVDTPYGVPYAVTLPSTIKSPEELSDAIVVDPFLKTNLPLDCETEKPAVSRFGE